MNPNRAARAVKILLLVLIAATVVGFVVMSLWNTLMPQLFGLHAITFWQALGLLVLAKLLFGGFHRHSGGGRWRHRMRERWEQMTPEERERFRQGMRCGRGPMGRAVEP
jgi:Ca2+/H+ antiporter, TMEM165/GDT1 family